MSMKPNFIKSSVKPFPPSVRTQQQYQNSFIARILGLERVSVSNYLRQENAELILINQRNMESIKSLSDQLAQALSFQQNTTQEIISTLKIVKKVPEEQENLHHKILDSVEKANYYVQTAAQDLIHAKNDLTNHQNGILDSLGAIEMAELMYSFLSNNLLVKQIQNLFRNILDNSVFIKDVEPILIKIFNNLKIVEHQITQINFKLEKYSLRIEGGLFKIYTPESQTAESIDTCPSDLFYKLTEFAQEYGIFEEAEKIKSIVIAESSATILSYSKEKSNWMVKRRSKVSILKPA